MKTADWLKSTTQRPGDGAHVNAILIADTHNISTCNSMCPTCCHHQYCGFHREQAFRIIGYKFLIFLEQNLVYNI